MGRGRLSEGKGGMQDELLKYICKDPTVAIQKGLSVFVTPDLGIVFTYIHSWEMFLLPDLRSHGGTRSLAPPHDPEY